MPCYRYAGVTPVVHPSAFVHPTAVLHGCQIGEDAMVGMNAVVMDDAHIAPRSIVAACAFVKAGFACEEQSLVMGAPARVSRQLTDKEVRWKQAGTREYQVLAQRSREAMEECAPLAAVEVDRPSLPASEVKPKGAS